jgi:hypothetical protein
MSRPAALLLLFASCATLENEGPPPFYPDHSNLLLTIDPDGQPHPVRSPRDWARRRRDILRNFELVSGEPPASARIIPPDLLVLEEKTLDTVVRRKVTFLVEEGDRLPAYLLLPRGLKKKAPAVLCLHQTSKMGKAEPVGMGMKNLGYALELAQRGLVTLSPDYPGFGDYAIDVYARGWASATRKGIWNHMRAVDLLQSLPEVDPDRIGVIGHSLGGHNAIFLGVFDLRIRAVVSSCGFNAFPKYSGGNLRGWSHRGYMPRIQELYGADPRRVPFDFPDLVAALAPRPFFANAPLGDANFEVSGVRDCVEAARQVYGLLGAPEALQAIHPDCGHDFPPGVREKAYRWLEQALAP